MAKQQGLEDKKDIIGEELDEEEDDDAVKAKGIIEDDDEDDEEVKDDVPEEPQKIKFKSCKLE